MTSRVSLKIPLASIILFVALCCVLTIMPASARQRIDAEFTTFSQVDAYLTSEMEELHIPGMSIVLVQGDQIVHLNGFGVADPSGRLMTPQIPMLIGSVTKSFTALAIMQLVEADKLNLDTPVQDYLPWFNVSPPPDAYYSDANQIPDYEASSRITIRHLLNQTSGLSRATGEKIMADGDGSDTALERHVRLLSKEQMNRPAGIGFEYSNANYMTLGMVIQIISGMSYEDYVQEYIFKPLEMNNSYTSQAEAERHGMAAGYRQWFGFPIAADNLPYPRAMLPAGYLISSAEDLGHYLIAQLNGGRYGKASILSPQGIETLHTPATATTPEGYHKQPFGSYSMGWYTLEMNDVPVITHDGDTPSFHADVIIIPSGKWGIALLVNTNTVLTGDRIRHLAEDMTSILNHQNLTRVRTDFRPLILYIFMIGSLVFEVYRLASIARTWHKPLKVSKKRNSVSPWFRRVVLPLLIGAAVAFVMFVVMPHLFHVPWTIMLLNQPDLSWVILLSGSLALLSGILQCGHNVWKTINFPTAS